MKGIEYRKCIISPLQRKRRSIDNTIHEIKTYSHRRSRTTSHHNCRRRRSRSSTRRRRLIITTIKLQARPRRTANLFREIKRSFLFGGGAIGLDLRLDALDEAGGAADAGVVC